MSSFLLAGGVRPVRACGRTGWSIHHIYDGKFPASGLDVTLRAVLDGDHFTQSAGLVAIHPLADAAADEFAEVAWWLREQAYLKFSYDPDNYFSAIKSEQDVALNQ